MVSAKEMGHSESRKSMWGLGGHRYRGGSLVELRMG